MVNIITESEVEDLLPNVSCKLELQGLIGKGGQKQVYRAMNLESGKPVVFKVLKSNKDTLARVQREIRAVSIINHTHVPRIFETNVDRITDSDELIWIVEEFLDGENLRDILKRKKTFSLSEIVEFLDVMFSILEKTEAQNIVHRDIKPENIMVDVHGKYWLIDFGISKHLDLESITLTHAPYGLFTIGYSAAEQFRNRKREMVRLLSAQKI